MQQRSQVVQRAKAGRVVVNHKNMRGLLENYIKGWWSAKASQSTFERILISGSPTKLTHFDLVMDEL